MPPPRTISGQKWSKAFFILKILWLDPTHFLTFQKFNHHIFPGNQNYEPHLMIDHVDLSHKAKFQSPLKNRIVHLRCQIWDAWMPIRRSVVEAFF